MNQSAQSDKLSFTGERYTPEKKGNIYLEHMHRYLALKDMVEGKRVLDIASGEGFGSYHMAQFAKHVSGVDIAEEAVSHAQTRYVRDNLEYKVGSCSAIPMDDASVDVVVSFETIEHHDEHEQMMAEIRRVLKPGGVLIISSPDKFEYSDIPRTKNPYHVKELYRDEFTALLDANFKHRVLYGQRVVFGSALFAEDQSSAIYTQDGETLEISEGLQRPLYLVAVASDKPLKTLPSSSFFEQEVLESEVGNNQLRALQAQHAEEIAVLEQGLIQKDLKLQVKAREVQEQGDQINAMFGSISWRVTRPLRLVRRLIAGDFSAVRRIFHSMPRVFKAPLLFVRGRIARARQGVTVSPANTKAFNDLMAQPEAPIDAAAHMRALLSDDALPDVDISAVTHNSSKWIEDFSGALKALDYPASKMHIRFVDNASTDDTPARIRAALSDLNAAGFDAALIEQANVGFGGGHDTGIKAGKSAFALVTNVDLTFEPDALRRIVSHAVSDTGEAAAWEMRQKPYEHPKAYDPLTGTTNWNTHACVLLRRSAFDQVGGYSPDLFMYGEDVELSYRLRANDFVLRYNPHAVVYHYTYESAAELKPIQFTGSTFANLYIRMRYGTWRDVLAVPGMALWLVLSKERFAGARMKNLRNMGKLLLKVPASLIYNMTHKTSAAFPFSGWDYDLVRQGPFVKGVEMPEAMPKVTVITRSYKGREALLHQAMASVANQAYPNIEHLVAEDRGETLAPVITQWNEATPYDVVHVTGNQVGRSDAGNLALERASGQYCVFLDDDDQFYCDHIETLVAAVLKNPEARASYSLAFDVPGKRLSETGGAFELELPSTHAFMMGELDAEAMKTRNYLPIQAVLFERSLFEERGGFDDDLEMLEDWVLWQKYSHRVPFIYVPKTTSFYRTPMHAHLYTARMATLNSSYDTIVERMTAWRAAWDAEHQPPAPAGAKSEFDEINLLFPIGHFYSPIADPVDIASRKDVIFATKQNNVGIDFDEAGQLALLPHLKEHVDVMDYPLKDPGDGLTYFYENDQYPVLDAEFLFAALNHFKPKNMIEIGSGYSSLITADVNRRLLKGGLNFTCIEPFPRQFLIDGVDGITHLEVSKVEDLPLSYFDQLGDGDILFIDSSHVSKVGSDVNYLFFEIVPRLKPGVIVHVHDIFLPDEYPETWALHQNRNWNEQYVLQAFLQFNSEWKVLWAAHLMGTRHKSAVQKTFPRYPKLGGGGSFWMQRT